MAKNYINSGSVLDDLVAPSGGVTSGKGYLIGGMFVVALTSAAAAELFTGQNDGNWELDAATHASNQGIAQCGPVYWDVANARCTNVATGNLLIGSATAAKVSTDATVSVKLWPRAAAPVAAITKPAATGASNSTPYGFTTAQQANDLIAAVRALVDSAGLTGVAVPN
ncbi:DUF2190 family protein [Caulobacter sp. Root343]|uniref:DUF2190 family protein n=1 Tax=Caulobacter sp. Root343 TaxID=1736520 RepID=UPI0006FFB6B5|nr:DUF2190 family protein [Caulobacter sp. Root343]KQV66634.1 hypothetical protein ASC70_12435 [Caulobacter sp. Root343]